MLFLFPIDPQRVDEFSISATLARMDSESLIPPALQLQNFANETLAALERDDQESALASAQSARREASGLCRVLGADELAPPGPPE